MTKYFIRHTDINKTPKEVEEGAINESDLDIALMGRIRLEYGERLNQNMLNILENFAVGMDESFIPLTPTPMPTSSPMPSGMVQTLTPTPTPTINASITPTPTPTPTGVVATTPTMTPTATGTPVVTPTVTKTPAMTPTVTPSTVPPAVNMPDNTATWIVPSGSTGTALGGIGINGNGTYSIISKDPTVPGGTWLIAGGASRVEVFATQSVSGPEVVPFNGPYNTWLNTGSGAAFTFRMSSVGSGTGTASLTFRDSVTLSQLATATITVNLTKLP